MQTLLQNNLIIAAAVSHHPSCFIPIFQIITDINSKIKKNVHPRYKCYFSLQDPTRLFSQRWAPCVTHSDSQWSLLSFPSGNFISTLYELAAYADEPLLRWKINLLSVQINKALSSSYVMKHQAIMTRVNLVGCHQKGGSLNGEKGWQVLRGNRYIAWPGVRSYLPQLLASEDFWIIQVAIAWSWSLAISNSFPTFFFTIHR